MGEVELIPIIQDKDINPEALLESLRGKLSHFVLVGVEKNEPNIVFRSTYADGADALWCLQKGIHMLMNVVIE